MSESQDTEVPRGSHGLGDPRHLAIIDKLIELQIGDSVELPQLVVVGDQSSGKSSVLEGLTGIPFPRDSVLCTRFATQIIFRRALSIATNISIIPSSETCQDEAERMRTWNKSGLQSLDLDTFSQIFDEARKVMGIGDPSSGSKKSFSNDILKIEVVGPDQQHLSVVDVPGIFRNPTEGVTTQTDIPIIRAMVERYLGNSRSVILAVIPANVDIATQEILMMAKKFDAHGQRTLGVLTKPDLVDEGAEDNILNLMRGMTHKMKLGWCMVKNPGQKDLNSGADIDRLALEKAFFKDDANWSKLDEDSVGVHSLRLRLVDLLTTTVRKEFIHVRADVIQNLKDCERKLKALGPPRETKEQQQRFLFDLATRFQELTTRALAAHYGSDDAFDSEPSLRLANAVVRRNRTFSDDVLYHGHTMAFEEAVMTENMAETVADEYGEVEADDFDQDNRRKPDVSAAASMNSVAEKEIVTRYHANFDELDDLLVDVKIPANQGKGIIQWIEKVYDDFRGFEIGTFDPSLITALLKKQSSNWMSLALGYTSDLISIIHTYICHSIKEICQDDQIAVVLRSVMMDQVTERYKRAMEQAHFIVNVEVNPMTCNHYFADNLEKCKSQRMKSSLRSKVTFDKKYGQIVRSSDLDHISSMSNLQSTVQQLHDILKSYYKVARKRFVDNVCMQAAEYHLVRGPDSAVRVLSTSFVSDLKPEHLENIVGEDASTKMKRADLTLQIEKLKKAKCLLAL